MSLVKYRLKEVAADFGVAPKEIAQIIEKFFEKPKSNTQVLSEEELNVLFDYITQVNQIESLEQVFAVQPAPKAETVPTINVGPIRLEPRVIQAVQQASQTLRELEQPSMITEDFSWYQKYLPGMFFFLGIGDTPALHADDFNFNEQVLIKGADFFEKLAENYQ